MHAHLEVTLVIAEIAAWLFAVFVVDPVQAEVRNHLDRANLPAAALQQSKQCLTTEAPRLIERAGADPTWAVTTAIGVTVGWTSPTDLLDGRNPDCAVLIRIFDDRRRDGDGEA